MLFSGHQLALKSVKKGRVKNWRRFQSKRRKEDLRCTPTMHTRYRTSLGQTNWLQSRTQFQCCYKFSRCASKAASPTIGDVKALNKLVRQLKSQPVKIQFLPLTGPLRIIGFLDASYRNNEDGSSQRGMTVLFADLREHSSKDGMSYGSLVDYESQKISGTVLSTTVAELFSFVQILVHASSAVDYEWTYLVNSHED